MATKEMEKGWIANGVFSILRERYNPRLYPQYFLLNAVDILRIMEIIEEVSGCSSSCSCGKETDRASLLDNFPSKEKKKCKCEKGGL